MSRLVVVGAGGHAKVVIATCRAAGHTVAGVVDDNAERWGRELLGAPITGPVGAVLDDANAIAVLAIGANRIRAQLAQVARCRFAAIAHPSAVIDPSVVLGAGAVVFAGAVIQPDAVIGDHAIVNTAASIDHDCAIGRFVHLAPGTRLAGNVAIDEGAFLGIGTVAIPGVRVGAWTTVGAGAAITRSLPAGVVAVGVPARARPGP
ncbi:MAG TPA: acetyltransferase [Kofleriaceae bacterium]